MAYGTKTSPESQATEQTLQEIDGHLTGGGQKVQIVNAAGTTVSTAELAKEATLGDVKARLPAALSGGKLDVTLADVSALATHAKQDTETAAINAHRTLIRKSIPVVGVVDTGEVQVTGLTASTPYELRCWRSTPATTGGAATHRQRSFYEATGGAAADLAYQEAAALAIADGISVPLRPGPILVADAAGKLWVRYAVTGAGDINETLTLDLLPYIAG